MSQEFPTIWPPINELPVPTGRHDLELVAEVDQVRQQRFRDDSFATWRPAGTLSVTVLAPDGRLYDSYSQLVVRRVPGGTTVRYTPFYNLIPWYRTSLPTGRYSVHARGDAADSGCFPMWSPGFLARFGPVETECVIEEGVETHVELLLVHGGRLRVALPLPGPARDAVLARALEMPAPWGWNEIYAALEGEAAGTARLVDADGTAIELDFYVPGMPCTYWRKEILPGTSCLTDTVVLAGVYRLEVSMPGYATDSVPVEIRADEITEVRVPLRESR